MSGISESRGTERNGVRGKGCWGKEERPTSRQQKQGERFHGIGPRDLVSLQPIIRAFAESVACHILHWAGSGERGDAAMRTSGEWRIVCWFDFAQVRLGESFLL